MHNTKHTYLALLYTTYKSSSSSIRFLFLLCNVVDDMTYVAILEASIPLFSLEHIE